MKLLIIDADCRYLFPDLSKLPERIHLDDCRVLNIEEADAGRMKEIRGKDDKWEKCIFFTQLSGGVKKYHRDFVLENSACRCWQFVVLDQEKPGYRSQLLGQADAVLSGLPVLYEIVFDSSDSLEKTAKTAGYLASEEKSCLIASRREILASQVRDVLGAWLPDWKISSCSEDFENAFRYQDSILVVGEQEEDFHILPPLAGAGRVFFWLEEAAAQHQGSSWQEMLRQGLNDFGWNLADFHDCVFCSSLSYEEFARKLQEGRSSWLSLKEDPEFVMWDAYGLPVLASEYTEENISKFLEEHCCFSFIAELFQK